MAVRLPRSGAGATGLAAFALRPSLALAAGLPILFLHVDYQPGFSVSLGSATASVVLSGLVAVGIGLVALWVGLREGFAPLRAGRWIWLSGALLLALTGAASVYPRLDDGAYAIGDNLVTAVKFAEYAVLAPAVPLLVRTRRDLDLVLGALVLWSCVASAVGIAQIFGADVAGAWLAGRRQPSFLGHHDLAALSGAALALALVALLARPRWRLDGRLAVAAGTAGGLGLIVSGSSAGGLGIVAAAAALALVSWRRGWLSARRLGATAAIVAVVLGGVFVLRSGDFGQFVRFVGAGQTEREDSGNVQTYVQRTLLLYLGLKIWQGHPVQGGGWQGSTREESVYGPYLDDTRRRFPDAPALAFPSPAHPWGIQNAYVQALADLGLVGLALLLATLATGLWSAGRAALGGRDEVAGLALLGLAWTLVAMGVWTAVGLVSGIPLDALLWIALGVCAAAAAAARRPVVP